MKVAAKHPVSTPEKHLSMWRWGVLGLFLILVVGIGLVFAGRGAPATGTLAAEHIQHDFGQVGINGGELVAQFPLTVQGATRIVDLQSS